jgi:hypothetical protein
MSAKTGTTEREKSKWISSDPFRNLGRKAMIKMTDSEKAFYNFYREVRREPKLFKTATKEQLKKNFNNLFWLADKAIMDLAR